MKIILFILLLVPALLFGSTYYVATNGDDGDDGSIGTPWLTWNYGFNQLTAGDTLYVRGGVYYVTEETVASPDDGVYVSDIDGTATNRICVFNYPGEKPILDGSLLDEAVSTNGVQIARSEYWHIKGLTIRNFPQVSGQEGGIGGHHVKDIIFENIISYQNGGPGIWLAGGGGIEMTGNKFINCDSYDNYDPYSATDGGDADGFSIAGLQNLTDTIILIGCRSWGNSDDGYDAWETEGIIVFQDCWSFNNGYQADGDGNGFKLGRTISPVSSTYIRQVYNCIAFGNKKHGLVENGTTGLNRVCNFASYGNDGYGIIWDAADEASVYRNIISYDNYGDYVADHEVIERILDHNSYNASFFPDGPVVTDADFVSLDTMQLYRDRKPDGSLPDIDFLNLKPQSKLVDAGIDVGLDYYGDAPDIGASEFNPFPYNPEASFSFTKLNCETPYDVQFEDLSFYGDSASNITSYHWDFGDGGTSTLENPMHTFNSSGTFVVELSIFNDLGIQDTFMETIVLEVISPPLVHDQVHCGLESFTGIEGIGEGLKWYSDPSLSTVVFEGNFFFPEITDSGTYNFYVTQTIDNCTSVEDTVNIEIYVISPPLAYDQVHCGLESFTGIEGIGEGLKWYSDPALSTVVYEGNFFFPEITDSGTYNFYVTQTIDNCSSIADTVNIEIYNEFIIHIDSSICESEELFFGGAYINESGIYSDSLFSSYGCDSVVVLELSVNENPIIDIGEDTTLTNEIYELSISGVYDEYLWNDGYGGSSRIIDPTSMEDGNYLYSLTVTDNNGCKGSDTILITVDASSWISNREEAIIDIYPNPAKNILFIETGELGAYKLDITSIKGQLILSEEITDPISQIDLTPFQVGVYFVTVRSQGYMTTRKIVKL